MPPDSLSRTGGNLAPRRCETRSSAVRTPAPGARTRRNRPEPGPQQQLLLRNCGLRGRHPGDRHAVRRAAHVVEPRHVEERDRVRVAAVLAADAELEVRLLLAPGPGR